MCETNLYVVDRRTRSYCWWGEHTVSEVTGDCTYLGCLESLDTRLGLLFPQDDKGTAVFILAKQHVYEIAVSVREEEDDDEEGKNGRQRQVNPTIGFVHRK